jgi:hypothetical protein
MIELLAINPKIPHKEIDGSIFVGWLDDEDSQPGFEPHGHLNLGTDDNREETCELTLLGILLCLVLIYNNHVGNLKYGLYNKHNSGLFDGCAMVLCWQELVAHILST